MTPTLWILAGSGVALLALVVSEKKSWRAGICVTKPLASLGFIVLALVLGAWKTHYGMTLLGGFIFAMAGDLLLIPKSENFFKAGVAAFLLGHVFYLMAFVRVGLDAMALIIAVSCLLVVQRIVLRWLMPHVPSGMKAPILAYVQVISLMTLFAASAARVSGNPWIAVGAVAFFISDLSVARDKFVQPGFANKLWGLPLYYAAQFLLASTVSGS